MELKDVILSTLAELEETTTKLELSTVKSYQRAEESLEQPKKELFEPLHHEKVNSDEDALESELQFLGSLRERLLVLFEGFQAPNNSKIEAKIDLTLNFLEYVLANIDARSEKLKKGNN